MRPLVIEHDVLLDRLLEAFADLGFEGTSIRELCRHLGVSHNLIHIRYQSKDNAWYRAVDHGFEELGRVLTEEPAAGWPTDRLELLRLAMQRYAVLTIERPALGRIIQQEAARPGPRFDYMCEKYIEPWRGVTDRLIKRLQDEGVFRPGAIDTVYFFLTTWGIGGLVSVPDATAGVTGSERWRIEVARLAVDVVIDGLRAREAA
jgi:TetR/AcrR family transcriptional regulator